MKHTIRLLLLVLGVGLLSLGLFRQFNGHQVTSAQHVISPQGSRQPAVTEPAQLSYPKTLIIPKIGITAAIERVGMDEKGNMDVPEHNEDVAWFEPGYRPGTNGSAVIAGHLDTNSGAPAVFYQLTELVKGDRIQVVTETGQRLTFTVISKANYPSADFPLVKVFGPADRPLLNLITCEGTWNSASNSYSHRTVVYTELSS